MKKFKKILKWFFIIFGGIVLVLGIIIGLFMSLSPQFGGKVSKEQKAAFEKLDHYEDGKFINKEEIKMEMNCHSVSEMVKEFFKPDPNFIPSKTIVVNKFDVTKINEDLQGKARVTWLGHSSFLLEISGKVILIDPVFGQYAAPHKLLGRKRFNDEMSFEVEDLERIDAVIISHDHYDHLDYPTIDKIKDKIENVIVPLGVGNHFIEWGVPEDRVQQIDWWQEVQLGDLKIALTPSRHMSGRGLGDQSSTLWGSWCFISPNQKIYFSGDGGYGEHFKEIGNKYGPFDFAMMECGQYDPKWADVHMSPEETVQAGLDIKAQTFMPIHWGAFTLAPHAWTDPVERFKKKATELNASVCLPEIGHSVLVGSDEYEKSEWWTKFD